MKNRKITKVYLGIGIVIFILSFIYFLNYNVLYYSWLLLSLILISVTVIWDVSSDSKFKPEKIKEVEKKIEDQVKFKRKVKTGLLLKKSILYRIVVTLSQVGLMYLFTGDVNLSIGFSIVWNVFNTFEYFTFDYVFCRFFKVGKD